MQGTRTRSLALSVLLLAACKSSSSKEADSLLVGRVFVAGEAQPLANAEITLSDGSITKTDADGRFSLKLKGGEGKSIEASRDGFAPVSKEAPKRDGYVELYAKKSDAKGVLPTSKGGEISTKDGAKASLPANSLVNEKGKPSKESSIEIAVPDPRKSTDLPSLPGNFDAKLGTKQGKVSCESPMYLRAKGDDKELSLREGKKVTAAFPVRRADRNDKATLFRFDHEKQEWKARGEAKRSRNKALGSVYEAELDELGWWTVGEFYDELTCLRACVVDKSKQPVPFARALATGVDHFTQISAYAGEDGCFALDVRAKAQVSVSVQAIDGFVPAVIVNTPSTSASVAKDPKQCKSLGTLTIEAAPKDSDCPLGLRKCGDACVDVRADGENCGACDKACGGADGRELSCIDGVCDCPLGLASCGGDQPYCADRRGDPENCGKCGNSCAVNESCIDGLCAVEPGQSMPDGGTQPERPDGGMVEPKACPIPERPEDPECDTCVTESCLPMCSGECCPLLLCVFEKCDDPEQCAIEELCADEATPAAMDSYNAFFTCVYDHCREACNGTGRDIQCAAVAAPVDACQQGQLTCLGQTATYECDEGGTKKRYSYEVSATPTAGLCQVTCAIDGTRGGAECPYNANICGEPSPDTVPCDPTCGFPDYVPVPAFGAPNPTPLDGGVTVPPDPPGNSASNILSCGGDAQSEVTCDRGTGKVCCLRSVGDPYCDDIQCQSGGTETFFCDGTEDCSGGNVCCLVLDTANQQAICAANCASIDTSGTSTQMCHDDAGCGGGKCVRDATLPFFGVCQ